MYARTIDDGRGALRVTVMNARAVASFCSGEVDDDGSVLIDGQRARPGEWIVFTADGFAIVSDQLFHEQFP